MSYTIVFTENDPPEPRIVFKGDEMIIYCKKDEQAESDFDTLKSLSDENWWKIYKFFDKFNRKVRFSLLVKQANKACTRLKLLVGKIIKACTTRFSG